MINFSIRRGVLVVAAIAFLSIRAAAQTDAAFASALGGVPSGLATMAQLKTVSQKPATDPALGPPVSNDAWMKILTVARRDGEYTEPAPGESEDLGRWSITDDVKDPKSEFRQMSLTIIGRPLDETSMAIGLVFFGAMKLTATTTEVRAETWTFTTDHLGRVREASCQVATKTLDGKITLGPIKNLNIADPKTAAQYDAIIKYWAVL
jgi:hypothetical protein